MDLTKIDEDKTSKEPTMYIDVNSLVERAFLEIIKELSDKVNSIEKEIRISTVLTRFFLQLKLKKVQNKLSIQKQFYAEFKKQNIMKKLILIALVATFLFSCGKDEPKAFEVIPNAQISIRPSTTVAKVGAMHVKASETHLSNLEIVKQAGGLSAYNIPVYGNQPVTWGFAESQRDTIGLSLKMWASGIINENGYVPDFIEAVDLVVLRTKPNTTNQIDTIAYIPNAKLREAEALIKAAYKDGDNETVYRLFDEKFRFTAITGAEWRALKAENKQ